MRISDWSSDVCSSDLGWRPFGTPTGSSSWIRGGSWIRAGMTNSSRATVSMPGWPGCNSTQRPPEAGSWTVDSFSRGNDLSQPSDIEPAVGTQIGRASCRERGCQYVENSVGDVELKKKKK